MKPSMGLRSGLLARNAALNAAGQLAPLLLAIPLLPYILHGLGAERFAVLTLAWTVVGYFGFLDLGLGRAATRFVAGLVGAGRADGVSRVVWTALALQILLGIAGAALIALAAPFLAQDVLRLTDPTLLAETHQALVLVGVGLPFVLLSGTLSGVLEAHQRFDRVNAVRVPMNVGSLAVPAAGVALGWSLPDMVLGLIATRALGLLAFAALAGRTAGGLVPTLPDVRTFRDLVGFGGWLMLSLLAVPLFTYSERFLVGGLRSLEELAWYAVPFEIMARTAVIPSAVAMTLFPAFSFAQRSGADTAALFRRPIRILLLLQWPLLVTVWLFAGEILGAWMGAEVRAAATTALRVLAVAFFFNAFAQIALAGVQGLGRPDLKAKLDLVQLPLYIGTAALLIGRYGIEGAAFAKLLFTVTDTVVLFAFARRLGAPPILELRSIVANPARFGMVAAGVAGVALCALAPLGVRAAALVIGIGVIVAALWRHGLEPNDRSVMLRPFAREHAHRGPV
jgi:O-antigen/teichoic acid export membrane protein